MQIETDVTRGPDRQVTDLELLHYLLTHRKPAVGTADLKADFDVSINTGRAWLTDLVAQGYAARGTLGETDISMFWATDRGRAYYAARIEATVPTKSDIIPDSTTDGADGSQADPDADSTIEPASDPASESGEPG